VACVERVGGVRTDRFSPDVTYTLHQIPSATQYGGETILLLERPSGRR
jgi:hypothetical protein